MKNLIAFCLLAALLMGIARADATDTLGSRPLPSGTYPACDGNVDDFGDPGSRPPSSISWRSFGTRQPVAAIAKFYEGIFGQPPKHDQHRGLVWRLPGGLTYAIYPITRDVPWLACVQDLDGISSIILISKANT